MYFGQFLNPQVDEYLHLKFFKDKYKGIFIECGAYDGLLESSCLFFEQNLNWSGFNMEPNKNLYNKLIINRKNSKNINLALTDQFNSNKEVVFQEYLFKQNNIVSKHNCAGHGYVKEITPLLDTKIAANQGGLRGQEYKVKGISIADLVNMYSINCIDLFVLDIEGGELEVLKDLYLSKILPKVFCIEDNTNRLQDINNILLPLNYEFISKVHVNLHFKLKES